MGQIRGECLCGAVTFEASGELMAPAACHCAMCRRWHGSLGVYTSAPAEKVLLTGGENVQWVRSGDETERGFCRICGSKLFWRRVGGSNLDMVMGSLEAPTGLTVDKHIWVAFKGDYYDIEDGLPQYAESSANAGPIQPASPEPAADAKQTTRNGQCLCGAIHLTVTGPMRDISVCHCGQCRRWHGHAPAYSKARWTDIGLTGGEFLSWYVSSPEARRGFCNQCGSSLFWERTGSDAVSIPAGLLDAPTGLHTRHHIFVADKGDCYEIPDALPQFAGSGGNALPF
nr:GFA family protein [uncultured Dongia sp.]